MFEDVFEPLDEVTGDEIDEWGDVWDTGEKEDMWRADAKDLWSVDKSAPEKISKSPAPDHDQNDCVQNCDNDECEKDCIDTGSSGIFDDIFLDIF